MTETKEQSRQSSKRYRKRNPEKIKVADKKWRIENPEFRKQQDQRWRDKTGGWQNQRHYKKWTDEDDRSMILLFYLGLSRRKIHGLIGRSVQAIAYRTLSLKKINAREEVTER